MAETPGAAVEHPKRIERALGVSATVPQARLALEQRVAELLEENRRLREAPDAAQASARPSAPILAVFHAHKPVRGLYDDDTTLPALLPHAVRFAFGMHPSRVTPQFRERIREVLRLRYPDLCRSALRMLIEGDFTDGACPVGELVTGDRHYVRMVVGLADLAETLLFEQLAGAERPHAEQDRETASGHGGGGRGPLEDRNSEKSREGISESGQG